MPLAISLTSLLVFILTLALVGFVIWAILNWIPMPDLFKKLIIVVVVVVVVLWLISGLSGGGLSLPSLR